MSLQHALNWNDGGYNPTRDYSTNGYDSTSHSGTFGISAGDVGNYLETIGSENIEFTDTGVPNLLGNDNLTIYGKIQINNTGADQFIYHSPEDFAIWYDDTLGELFFTLNKGLGSEQSVSVAITEAVMFRFVARSTTTTMDIELDDGTTDTSSFAAIGRVASGDNVYLFNDGAGSPSDYADCRVEDIRYYDHRATDAQVAKLLDSDYDAGIVHTVDSRTGDHGLEPGDIIITDFGGSMEGHAVITADISTTQYTYLPLSTSTVVPTMGRAYTKCGHCWSNSEFMYIRDDSGTKEVVIMENINDIAGVTDTNNISIKIGKTGITGTQGHRELQHQIFGPSTTVTTGNGKHYFVISELLDGMVLKSVFALLSQAGITGTTDIQIANLTQGSDMLSTKLTIDSAEKSNDTAATPLVIDTANDDVNTHDVIRVDIDAVQSTPPQGLIIVLTFGLE